MCVEGSFTDPAKIRELATISDLITTEIEHVNVDVLTELENAGHVVHPNAHTLRIIQDKLVQKENLQSRNVPLPDFMDVPDLQTAEQAGIRFGYPFMLKNRRLGYDGRGNAVVRNESEVALCFGKLGTKEIYAEKWVAFAKELAVMIVRTKDGVISYPVVETVQQNNVCHIITAPAQISATALKAAQEVASNAIASFDGIGIYGVEMFLLHDDTVVLNEIAPRLVHCLS